MYLCDFCEKNFKTKQGLDYHLSNTVCQKNNYVCNACNKSFANKSGQIYHVNNKVCEKTVKHKITLKKEYDHMSKEEMIARMVVLETENRVLKENPQIVNNINIDKQQINILAPPAFKELDTVSTLMKLMPNLLHNALSKHPTEFIAYLIENTNCNPEFPIFNSAKITNKKDDYAKVSNGKQYVYKPRKKVIDELINNKKDILTEYIKLYGDQYSEKILNRHDNYITALADEKETLKELENEITCMLLNMKDIIGSEDWSNKLMESLKEPKITQILNEIKFEITLI